MILDDLAAVTPEAHERFKSVHCIRVPWCIGPDMASSEWKSELIEDARKLVPRMKVDGLEKQVISWTELALPYRRFCVVSEHSQSPYVWHVESIVQEFKDYKVRLIHLEIYAYVREKQRWSVCQFLYIVTGAGQLCGATFDLVKCVGGGLTPAQSLQRSLALCGTAVTIERAAELVTNCNELHCAPSKDGGHLEGSADANNFAIIITALAALLSCKNVSVEAVCAPKKLQRARMKRGKLPLYTYHVLKIRQSRLDRRKDCEAGDGEAVGIHWVRGHFKRYTECNKLFGKHTGLYWWQPHIAGTAERIVDKDYELSVTE